MNMVGVARRLVPAAALAAFLTQASALNAQNPENGLAPPIMGELPVVAETFLPQPPGITVTPYATGLGIIWSLEFAPDGRLFVAEREGRVRVISRTGELDPTPWVTLPTEIRLEDGLLGMTLDPDFGDAAVRVRLPYCPEGRGPGQPGRPIPRGERQRRGANGPAGRFALFQNPQRRATALRSRREALRDGRRGFRSHARAGPSVSAGEAPSHQQGRDHSGR